MLDRAKPNIKNMMKVRIKYIIGLIEILNKFIKDNIKERTTILIIGNVRVNKYFFKIDHLIIYICNQFKLLLFITSFAV